MAFFPATGLPQLCVFFQQMTRYFLLNYLPKIRNYAGIMRIAQKFLMFQFIKLGNLH